MLNGSRYNVTLVARLFEGCKEKGFKPQENGTCILSGVMRPDEMLQWFAWLYSNQIMVYDASMTPVVEEKKWDFRESLT